MSVVKLTATNTPLQNKRWFGNFDSALRLATIASEMRMPVSLVVNLVANGKQVPEILEEYPNLEPDDIQQSRLWESK
jgi:Protein of unknown function (DUF433)